MEWFKDRSIRIILYCINILLALKILVKCYNIQQFNYLWPITCIFIFIILYYIFSQKLKSQKSKKILFVAILSAILIFIIYQFKVGNIDSYINSLMKNFNKLNSAINKGETTQYVLYKPYLILGMPIITLILLPIIIKKGCKVILFLNLTLVILLWYTNFVLEVKEMLGQFIFISISTYFIDNYNNYIESMKELGVKVNLNFKFVIIYGTIICFLIANICAYVPQSFKGKLKVNGNSKFVNSFASTKTLKDAKKEEFNLSYSGYNNDDKKLGGPININSDIAFNVKSNKLYYLKGAVKDFYDGFMWKRSGAYENKFIKKTEKSKIGNPKILGLTKKNSIITIYPKELKTNTLFTPNYAYDIKGNPLYIGDIYFDSVPIFLSTEVLHKQYTIKFHNINGDIDNFKNLKNYKVNFTNRYNIDEDMYKNEVKKNYFQYLQVPSNISNRVKDVAYSIDSGNLSRYEKVEKIKEYLENNYKYSLNVSKIPKNEEFIDYFLFTEKKGYCTYFATTVTIMCRLMGIPARYVEGYKMAERKDEYGYYKVTNEDAHAWTEILIDPYADLWCIVDCSTTPAEQSAYKMEANTSEESSKILINRNNKNKTNDFEISNDNNIYSSMFTNKEKIILMVLILLIVLILLRIKIHKVKINKMFKSISNINFYNYWLSRLKCIGFVKSEYIGDKEFSESISDKKIKEMTMNLVDNVYQEFYGSITLNCIDKKYYYNYIEERVKNRQGKARYYIKMLFIIFL